jgi:hypothetical protein
MCWARTISTTCRTHMWTAPGLQEAQQRAASRPRLSHGSYLISARAKGGGVGSGQHSPLVAAGTLRDRLAVPAGGLGDFVKSAIVQVLLAGKFPTSMSPATFPLPLCQPLLRFLPLDRLDRVGWLEVLPADPCLFMKGLPLLSVQRSARSRHRSCVCRRMA